MIVSMLEIKAKVWSTSLDVHFDTQIWFCTDGKKNKSESFIHLELYERVAMTMSEENFVLKIMMTNKW